MPMLATLVHEVPIGSDWAYEMKWDGVRALVLVRDGKVRITSRTGRDITAGYPELRALGDALGATDALLDGEIVALDDQGRPSFQLLQRRMHVRDEASLRALQQEVPVAYMIFDLLWLDGNAVTELPYTERRRRARGAGAPSDAVADAARERRRTARPRSRPAGSSVSKASSPSASTRSTKPAAGRRRGAR